MTAESRVRWWRGWLESEDYRLSRRIFLIALGLIYLCAFLSLWWQIPGLIGSRGILPASDLLDRAREELTGLELCWRFPTLCWLSSSDSFLGGSCLVGCLLSVALLLGFAPRLVLLLLWALYLSFVTVGGDFLRYQWDALLLETGLLAVLFAPPGLRPRLASSVPPTGMSLFLLRWLLFRLMLLSGLVKLLSQDEVWWNLSALQYHYWTQPLPSWTSHYVHHLPAVWHRISCAIMFAIELVLPFFIFGPRRLRLVAAAGFVLLQVSILATGNYGFFNLLAIALCIPLLDDRALGWKRSVSDPEPSPRWSRRVPLWLAFALFFGVSTVLFGLRVRVLQVDQLPGFLRDLVTATRPFASINTYGLFADMTEERPEILVEGSNDGREWRAYEFRWKPGQLDRPPRFTGPHMPRLDWQMWFAALGYRGSWYLAFMRRLLEGSPEVAALMATSPYPQGPPRYVRSTLYSYRFSDPGQRRAGIWWRAERKGEYLPAAMLENGRLVRARF